MPTHNYEPSLHPSQSEVQANQPSFFIVGAPRCGTTALCDFLNQHPDIYISDVKEPHYFGSDLEIRRGFSSEEKYLKLFQEAENQLCGEGSTWYLYSQCAAQEIHDFNPEAKIIIMLRNPADLLHSWFGHVLLTGEENIEDFEEALAAENDRRHGERIPKGTPVHKLLYREIPCFTEQIERFYGLFGRKNVHIIIYDDFSADQLAVVKDTLHFLGVNSTYEPTIRRVNSHSRVRSKTLRSLVESQPEAVRKVVRRLLPRKLRTQFRHSLSQLNMRQTKRETLDPELRDRLNSTFESEVQKLSALLGRDLSHWTNPRSGRGG